MAPTATKPIIVGVPRIATPPAAQVIEATLVTILAASPPSSPVTIVATVEATKLTAATPIPTTFAAPVTTPIVLPAAISSMGVTLFFTLLFNFSLFYIMDISFNLPYLKFRIKNLFTLK
ncbi:hypothetical protein [Spiroplasma endosymbiont of Dasysyrphus albostriatus]|uniref:hypothetical protein n=1 Tax=Spiroplasma endosymbiont of Dasysyrphus albostriatus TaxID=3066299 RepID=UPI0030CB77B8